MKFHVGSDHGGVTLREILCESLRGWEHAIVSVSGPVNAGEKADYPDVASAVCRRVLAARAQGEADVFGLLVCGTGPGMAIAANKVPGIRAGVVGDAFSAQMIRGHNDANVICLGERVVGSELAKVLLRAFVDTPFEGGRHARRVDKINALSAHDERGG